MTVAPERVVVPLDMAEAQVAPQLGSVEEEAAEPAQLGTVEEEAAVV